MKRLKILRDHKEIEVCALKMSGKLWLHYNGETFQYSPELMQAQSKKGMDLDPRSIISPMPGKVIKLFKKTGDLVEEGQTLVVIEAMKMEYNLKAIKKMRVKKINCLESDNVNLGQKLIELEEINE